MTDSDVDDIVRAAIRRHPFDPDRIQRVLEEFYPLIHRFVKNRLYDREMVDDVVQNVFTAMYRFLPSFRFESSFRTWLYQIALNEVGKTVRRETARREARQKYGLDPVSGPRSTAASPAARLHDQMEVEAILEQLAPTDSEVIRLHYFDGFSIVEMAAVLDLGESAVKMRLSRARERFASLWNAQQS